FYLFIAIIGYKYIAGTVYGDCKRVRKTGTYSNRCAAANRYLLNCAVAIVGYVNVTISVHTHPGSSDKARTYSHRRPAANGYLFYGIIATVGYVNVAPLIYRYIKRLQKAGSKGNN